MGKTENEIKKIGKVIHPKSRKAKNLSRKLTRENKMVKKKAFSNMKLQLTGEKLMWFKDNFTPLQKYSYEEMEKLIYRYINRHSDELQQIITKQNIGNRKSRQHASREDILRINKEKDLEDFNGPGLETIDLTDEENVKSFKLWNGELRYITNLKLQKFKVKSKLSDLLPCDNESDDIEMKE